MGNLWHSLRPLSSAHIPPGVCRHAFIFYRKAAIIIS
nr:MAG TPA: hypothetical protein [Caudoviricetes sp.]